MKKLNTNPPCSAYRRICVRLATNGLQPFLYNFKKNIHFKIDAVEMHVEPTVSAYRPMLFYYIFFKISAFEIDVVDMHIRRTVSAYTCKPFDPKMLC